MSTHGGADVYLLAKQLNGRLELTDFLWMAVMVRLAVIPSADKALSNLGTFDFFALHVLSAGERHSSAVTKLLRLIERL